jgi:hypothetical protein
MERTGVKKFIFSLENDISTMENIDPKNVILLHLYFKLRSNTFLNSRGNGNTSCTFRKRQTRLK